MVEVARRCRDDDSDDDFLKKPGLLIMSHQTTVESASTANAASRHDVRSASFSDALCWTEVRRNM